MKRIIILSVISFVLTIRVNSQQCTQCLGPINTGIVSSAIGTNTKSSGNSSFASGFASEATGDYSTALGFYAFAGTKSVGIGSMVKALYDRSVVIGSGGPYNSNIYLTNGVERSLMVGFSSIYPTLFVSESTPSANFDKTGKIAIGHVITPILNRAKLHIRADAGEAAALLVEPNTWATGSSAMVQVGNLYHGILGSFDRGLEFKTQKNYIFREGNVGIGTETPTHLFHVVFNLSQFYLDNNTLTFESKGAGNNPAIQLTTDRHETWTLRHNYSNSALEFVFSNAITPKVYFKQDGSVGIGTAMTTINNIGYKLVVLGKIITEEVMVMHPDQWYDQVFDNSYKLTGIDELNSYIQTNRHLPGIPTTAEVMENGVGLAHMNGLLLQKVEELTLYIINQEERIQALEEKLNANNVQSEEK